MVAFVNSTSNISAANSSSFTVPFPGTISAGNALLLAVGNSAPVAFATPSGWTQVQANGSVGADLGFGVYSLKAVGTETGNLTVSVSAGNGLLWGQILNYSGVASSPFGTSNLATTAGTVTVSPTLVALSPGANDFVVRFYQWGQNTAATGATVTNPATWTSRLNQVTNDATAFNGATVSADKQAGVDSQTVTSNTQGAFAVTQVILVDGGAVVVQPTKALVVPGSAAMRAANY